MKQPWKTFTNSRETMRLMGMKVLQRMKQEPKEIAATLMHDGLLLKRQFSKLQYWVQPQQQQPALPKLQRISKTIMAMMYLLTVRSMLLVLLKGELLFIMMAVSFPMQITSPVTHSVFFTLQPRSIMFFLPIFSFISRPPQDRLVWPWNAQIQALGLMQLIEPSIRSSRRRLLALNSFCRSERENLGLRFFSPSREAVSTQDIPDLLALQRTSRSAGITSSFFIRRISPIFMSFHCDSLKAPSMSFSQIWELSASSERQRLKSSKPSRRTLSESTKMRGAMALQGLRGEMRGMLCMMAQARKQMLAYLLNCRRSARGRKVMRLYLVVEMQLVLVYFYRLLGTSTRNYLFIQIIQTKQGDIARRLLTHLVSSSAPYSPPNSLP